MSTFAPALAQLAIDCESEGLTVKNSEKIAVELAKFFNVHQDEIGILRLDKESLLFVHPAQLHNVGRIPLNSSTSLAVRTANSKRPEIVNNFARIRHASFFEMIDVGSKSKDPGKNATKATKEEQIIQKIMSVPVVSMNKVLGVIQVCRKGATAPAAGLDFSPVDLQKLVSIAAALARCFIK
jgi:hypothetical protein